MSLTLFFVIRCFALCYLYSLFFVFFVFVLVLPSAPHAGRHSGAYQQLVKATVQWNLDLATKRGLTNEQLAKNLFACSKHLADKLALGKIAPQATTKGYATVKQVEATRALVNQATIKSAKVKLSKLGEQEFLSILPPH